ncbi:radical SAM protein [Alkalibaculum sp. M08DMB]|uniref:Radical SAM protein n=1 Tax=Alkalibaculum sporogenes TaxID=2655001 RepID=A0A6A7K9F5_9FIRM|nr:radical SAM protein [Alkalibaculum sporogenes]MPW26054.1 radical SAM protein [Alkalibaculum sporogenes]
MDNSTSTKVISIFIPHEGCPHDCVFCNQKKISGSVKSPDIKDIEEHIETALTTLDNNSYNIVLAFYGGSFTAIKREKQIEYLRVAKYYKDRKSINSIRLSTRPDYMKDEHVSLLKEYNVDHVELGIQSTHPKVLKLSKRYYSIYTINQAVMNLSKYNIDFGFQIMIGLPGDNRQRLINTCFELAALQPNTLRIYPTLVIVNTELQEMYKNMEYTPLTLLEARELSIIPYIIFKNLGSNIIRVGLHASESLLLDDNIVAGPFHSAFGEMVQSSIYWAMIKSAIVRYRLQNKNITIIANARDFSKITGNKGENRVLIKDYFNVEYKFQKNDSLKDDIIIQYENYDYLLRMKEYYNDIINQLTNEWHCKNIMN